MDDDWPEREWSDNDIAELREGILQWQRERAEFARKLRLAIEAVVNGRRVAKDTDPGTDDTGMFIGYSGNE